MSPQEKVTPRKSVTSERVIHTVSTQIGGQKLTLRTDKSHEELTEIINRVNEDIELLKTSCSNIALQNILILVTIQYAEKLMDRDRQLQRLYDSSVRGLRDLQEKLRNFDERGSRSCDEFCQPTTNDTT